MNDRNGFLLVVVLLTGSGCGRGVAPPGATTSTTPRAPSSREYPLKGTVIKVERDAGQVAIRHEAIPDFMPVMTMTFDLKGQDVLQDLQPGDKVEGTLRVREASSELVGLEITEMAQPEPVRIGPKVLQPGQLVPDFAMTSQDGSALRLADLQGKVVALTFIYTRCPLPDICPAMDRRFGELAERLQVNSRWTETVRLLSISFDPEHDTPEVLATHARQRGAKPPLWTFAVATHAELAKVAGPLGLMYGPTQDQIIHNLTTVIITPDGKLARQETGKAWTTTDVFKTIVGLVPARTKP
jgi:protein SCO1/2